MFKRFLKIFGVCMAIFVGVCGLGVGIFALRGGFKDNEINILRLYIDDATKADKTIYTLTDFTTRINFEPLDATNRDLEVSIQDPMRIVENGNLVKEGILKNVPSVIKAGEEFNIQINKDANGNNYGGAVTLTFKPKGNDKAITEFRLKVVVDVAIPNNALYFAGNNGDNYSTATGKTITMGISNNVQHIFLKSNLINAFCLETEDKNLKQAEISYIYKNLEGKTIEEKTFSNLAYDRIYNSVDKEYNYYFKVPVTPRESGTIVMSAKMHKTYEIEQAYIDGGFDTILDPTLNPSEQAKLDRFNEFVNKYIKYFDTTEESYKFFSNCNLKNDGSVSIPYTKLSECRKYIFQTTSATIKISAVNLDSITSTDDPQNFKVFSSNSYTVSDLINKFDLDITLSEDNVAQDTDIREKQNLFATLQVSPYIYLEKEEYENTRDLWQNYSIMLAVTDFTNTGKPVVSDETDNIEGIDCIGYLIALGGQNSYKEYITCNLSPDASNKVWTLNFNTPLTKSSTETTIKSAKRTLFLQFQVSGRNLDTNEKIVKNAYTRILVDYDEYQYRDQDSAKLTFSTNLQRMSINDKVQNSQNYNYTKQLNMQNINLSLKDSITNSDNVQYKRIMYFAEKTSNRIDNGGGSKLATVGSYKFRYMNAGVNGTTSLIKRFNTEEDLIGERLLNYGTIDKPDYRLYAINASTEPVRIFAIVYLSDIDGKPIDINGRPITIDENLIGAEEPVLTVFAITDITETGMTSVVIDNFVNNMNYYTVSKIGYSINDDVDTDDDGEGDTTITYSVGAGEWIKRNIVIDDYYTDPNTGYQFSKSKTEEIQKFLQLKLLYKNRISLYATNFELSRSGEIADSDKTNTTLLIDVKDFYGKPIKDKAYDINTYQNKQLALNQMIQGFNSNYYLNILATNGTPVQKTEIIYSDPNDPTSAVIGIKFELVAEGKSTSNDDYIYIKARDGVANSLDYNKKDYVAWTVNSLDVEDITLFQSDNKSQELNTYNKLYSNYSSNKDDGQLFGNVIYNESFQFTPYYLYTYSEPEGNGYVKGSIADNVYFAVRTNLYGNYDGMGDSVNVNLVDMSQADFESTAEVTTDPSLDIFSGVYDYIEYYTKNTMTMNITYQNAGGMAQLKQDLYFPSDYEYVTIGNKKFAKKIGTIVIDGKKYDKYITAGGRNYGIEISDAVGNFYGEEVVKINKGEYFPIIKNYTINGKPVVIICDEKFIIENDETDSNGGLIYNIEDTATGNRRPVKVSKVTTINGSTYNVNNYIDDGEADKSKTSLKKKLNDDGKVESATVKFKKGGTLRDESNNEIFVKDENGKYFFNTITNKYEICPNETSKESRYSKKGIMAYLMITYNFKGLYGDNVNPITKVIAYELIQEPVTLVATGNVNGEAGGVELQDSETITDSLTINAGTTNEFILGNVNSPTDKSSTNTISIVGASYERNFFYHCTLKIEDGMNSKSRICFVQGGVDKYNITINDLDERILLKVPNQYTQTSANVIISYTDENGKTVDKVLRLKIIPNYTFDTKNNSGVTTEESRYIITLAQDSEYVIKDLINNYFNLSKGSIELINKDTTNKYAKVESDKLKIGKSYAYYNGSVIIQNNAEFEMVLVDGSTRIAIDRTLYITITPKYTIDMRNLSGDILYGSNVINPKYIDIYYGTDRTNKVNSANFKTVANEIGLTLYRNGVSTSGMVISDNMYTSVNGVKFNLGYTIGFGSEMLHEISLNVIAFEKFYSEEGKFVDDDTYANVSNNADANFPSEMKFAILPGEQVNINKYIQVFTKDTNHTNIYALLTWNDGTDHYTNIIGDNIYGTFTLCYALNVEGSYVILAIDNSIRITVNKLELYYKSNGFTASETYGVLTNNDSYKLVSDFEITTTEDGIDIDNYLKFYSGSESSKLEIVLIDSSNQVVTSNTNVASSLSGNVYSICYKFNGKIFNTGYTVKITKSN